MKKRDSSFDFVKGVLIWLVVLGHSIQNFIYYGSDLFFGDPIFKAIYIFHMPLFIGISGYFFDPVNSRNYKFFDFLKRRASQILSPMVVWVLISALFSFSMYSISGSADPIAFLRSFILALMNSYWFLWVVFLSYVILSRLFLSRILTFWAAICIETLLLLAPLEDLPVIGYVSYMFAFMFPFFFAGMILRDANVAEVRSVKLPLLVLALIVVVACYYFWKPQSYAYVNHMNILDNPVMVTLTFIGGAFGSILAIASLRCLYRLVANSHFSNWVVSVGRVTLPIYLAQGFIFTIAAPLVGPNLSGHSYPVGILFCLFASFTMVWLLKILVDMTSSSALGRVLWGAT